MKPRATDARTQTKTTGKYWRLTTNPFYILPLCCQETGQCSFYSSNSRINHAHHTTFPEGVYVHLQSDLLGTSELATGLSAAVRAVDTEPVAKWTTSSRFKGAKRSATTVAISSTLLHHNARCAHKTQCWCFLTWANCWEIVDWWLKKPAVWTDIFAIFGWHFARIQGFCFSRCIVALARGVHLLDVSKKIKSPVFGCGWGSESLYLSVSLSVSQCLSVSVCLSVSLSVSLCVSLSLSSNLI